MDEFNWFELCNFVLIKAVMDGYMKLQKKYQITLFKFTMIIKQSFTWQIRLHHKQSRSYWYKEQNQKLQNISIYIVYISWQNVKEGVIVNESS